MCLDSGRYSDFFSGRLVHTPNPQRRNHGWRRVEKFSKFTPPDARKIYSLVVSFLRLHCKTFYKYLKFTLQNTHLRG